MKKILCLILMFCLACPAFSASIVIDNYTPAEVKTVLMKFYIKHGANIKNASDYQLIIDEQGDALANLLLGTKLNPYVTLRTTYNFVQDGNSTLTNINMAQIVNPNSAFENAIPFPDKKLLPIAQEIKNALNGYYSYGFRYNKTRKYLKIVSVLPDTIGIDVGDKIYKINNMDVKGKSLDDIKRKLTPLNDDTDITLYLIRDKQEKTVTLKSRFIPPAVPKL